jgi:hypothetical protein
MKKALPFVSILLFAFSFLLTSCASIRLLSTTDVKSKIESPAKLNLATVELKSTALAYSWGNYTRILSFNNANFLLKYFADTAPESFLKKINVKKPEYSDLTNYSMVVKKSNLATPYVTLNGMPEIFDTAAKPNAAKAEIIQASNTVDRLCYDFLNQTFHADYYLALRGGTTEFIPGLFLIENTLKTEVAVVLFSSNGTKVFSKNYTNTEKTKGEPSGGQVIEVFQNTFIKNQQAIKEDLGSLTASFTDAEKNYFEQKKTTNQ